MAEANDPPPPANPEPEPDHLENKLSTESLDSLPDPGQSLEPTDDGESADTAGPSTHPGAEELSSSGPTGSDAKTGQPATPPARSPRFKWLRRHINVYSLLFVFVLLLAATIIFIANRQNHRANNASQIKTQGLSQSTLDQLAKGDVTVGSNQSVLSVRSSAIFAGQVLIKQGLQVAGSLQISGTASFNDVVANGTSQFGQVNVKKDLAVSGNTALQGSATIGGSLQVSGGGTFGGSLSAPQITANKLQLNGDLVLTHHISTGGGRPSHSGGSALGSGGSVSVSGSDIAGSVNVNTGGSPAAGCFVTINFTSHYGSTPYVLITPVGSSAGGLDYYINRSSANFSICDASPPPAGKSFSFDYFVID